MLAGPAYERLAKAELQQLCVTDTIPVDQAAAGELGNVVVLSVAELIGEAIRRIHEHLSISALFQD